MRVLWGDVPDVGDELRTKTGRRYQVIEVRGRQIAALVLQADAPVQGKVIDWTWGDRSKRAY